MAKTLPEGLTKKNIFDLQEALTKFYPVPILGPGYQGAEVSAWAVPDMHLSWKSGPAFLKYITDLTETTDIVNANKTLEAWAKVAPQKTSVEAARPTKEQLETSIAEAEKKEVERQKAIKESNDAVRQAIAKQQEIHDRLAATKPKIYVKSGAPQVQQLSGDAQAVLDNLKTNPSIPNITEQLEKSITPSLENQISKEQIRLIALDAAYKAVDAANNPGKYAQMATQSAILNAVARDKDVIPKLITDSDILANIRTGANELAVFQNLQVNSARMVWGAFDPALAKTLFADPSSYQISLSETQLPGYETTFSPDGMIQGYTGFLSNNLEFFGKLAGLPIDEFQQKIMSSATSWIERQIVTNFPQAAQFFASPESQLILSGLGIGTTTVELTGSFASFFVENPATLPILNFFGQGLGINFSVGSITGTAASQGVAVAAAESVATTGGVMAGEAFIGGAAAAGGGAAAGAAVGQAAIPVPLVGAAIGAVIGAVGPKVVKAIKDNVYKYGKFLVAGVGALFGAGLALAAGLSPALGGILGGLGGYGLGSFLSGGPPAVGAGISSAFSAAGTAASFIWATFLAGVGTPILVSLLTFPVVVAFILFIINSGAYVVPPAPAFEGSGAITSPYIDVIKTANPAGPFQNTDLPLAVEYTVTIKAKKGPLSNVRIDYSCSVIKEAASTICPDTDPAIPTAAADVSPASPLAFTYKQTYDALNFQDSFVTDIITVTADAYEEAGAEAAGSATIKIGEPPENCPSIWPVGSGNVTQGAYTTSSHKTLEAVDIGTSPTPVLAGHSGIVVSSQNEYCYGKNIKIQSNCGGRDFVSRYAHLESLGVKRGDAVTMGQTIGLSGNSTGGAGERCSSGHHLHYDFHYWPGWISTKWPSSPPFMMSPYIPKDVPRGCVDNCGVSI